MQHQRSKRIRLEQLPTPADRLHDMTLDRMSIDKRTDIGLVRLVRLGSISFFLCAENTLGWLKCCKNSLSFDSCVFTEEIENPSQVRLRLL